MHDDDARRAGIAPVDATGVRHPEAEDFKHQVQCAILKHIHDVGTYNTIKRLVLSDDDHPVGSVQVAIYGMISTDPIGVISAPTPFALADGVYQWMKRR